MKPRWMVAVALVLLAGLASALTPTDRMTVMDSLRHLPPNIRSYYLDKAGFDMWPAAQPRPESTGLRLIGKWGGGPSVRVTGRDSIVYLSRGSEVVVINFADTANPRVLTTIQAPGLVARSILVGNRLYVSSGYIETFDISDPASPVKLGSVLARAPAIDVVDTLVYTLYRDSFKVYNFSDPANPQMLGACRDSGYDLSICNGYAYIGDRWGLYVLDVTNPASPHRIASWGSDVISVKARGNICCATLADANDNLTFYVLDTRQPASVVPLGSLADQGGYDLYLADSLVFISGYYTGSGYEFKILSVGDSAHPRLIGQASTLGDNNGVWANVAENLAFVADRTEGLQVFDISTLSNPRRDTTLLAAGPSLDIAVHGDLAAVANQPAGMKLLSVANPVNPFELGSMDSTYDWPDCDAVELTDSFAFMGWQPNPYLRTILVTDPTHPEKVGACDGMQNDAQDMVLRDSLLYTVSLGRLYVVNVARPREPVLLGTCVCGGGGAVVLQDSFAYTAAGVQQVVNVARPDSPFVVSTISGHGATGLAVRDTFLYVPYVYDTLLTYSVATPSQPRLLSAVQTGVWPWDVVLGEMKAYVALSDGLGVEVFDLSDPTYPTSRGTTSAPYDVRRLRYSNGLLYAALWEAGVAIYETTAIGITERDCRSRLTGKGVSVSPDPASDFVRVAARGGSRRGIRVMDVAGRDVSVRVRPLTLGAADGVALDVSRLRCGIYFVRWDESGTSRPAKFVKQ